MYICNIVGSGISNHLILDFQIQGTEPNPHLASPLIEQFEAMYNEGAPDSAVQQGLYYPIATNYGYICTGNILLYCAIVVNISICFVMSYLRIMFFTIRIGITRRLG